MNMREASGSTLQRGRHRIVEKQAETIPAMSSAETISIIARNVVAQYCGVDFVAIIIK